MRFIDGSPLSNDDLRTIAENMVDAYGENARDVVNHHLDECDHVGDFVEYQCWLNVAFGVMQILRPNPRWNNS